MRLIDLHTDWLLQYTPEATVFDAALYPRIRERLGQSEGYLQGAWAAVLSCYRAEDDWARQADPWAASASCWRGSRRSSAAGSCSPPRTSAGGSTTPRGSAGGSWASRGSTRWCGRPATSTGSRACSRGVRLFQPVYAASSVLGGSSTPGDERGLTDLGRAFLEALADLAAGPGGPCPVLDLAHLNPHAAAEALDWFEADDRRATRLIPVSSHGAPRHKGFATPRAITPENLRRLRALGGVVGFSVGPPFYDSAGALKEGIEAAAAVPFRGRPGIEGIAIGTDFLGVDQTLPRLGHIAGVVAWLSTSFDPATAAALIQGNARQLLARIFGHGSKRAEPS